MAAAEARAVWQRTATNRLVQEDSVKAPKLAHCHTQKAVDSHSFHLSNSWGSMDTKVDLPRQLSPSTHRDYRSEYLGVEDVLGSRFKPGLQALAAERDNAKSGSAGYMGVTSEYSVGSDVDLGWQFVLDPKPTSASLEASEFAVVNKRLEEDSNTSSAVDEEREAGVLPKDEPLDDCITAQEISSSNINIVPLEFSNNSIMAEEIMTKSGEGLADQRPCFSSNLLETTAKPEKDILQEEINTASTEQSTESLPVSTWPSSKSFFAKAGSSWRTADKEELAVLVAQKTSEKLENCDLPTPRSGSSCKTPLESWEILVENSFNSSKSLDRDLFASTFQDGELSRLENLGLQSSSLMCSRQEPIATPSLPATSYQPLSNSVGPSMPTHHRLSHSYSSADNRNTSWSGGGGLAASLLGKSSSPLVEALCHSQTRARQAEQRAEQTSKEYNKLSHLLFREASLSLTYRHWVCSLQAENAWLKMCVRNHHGAVWLQHSFPSPFAVLDQLSSNPWKHFGKENIHRQMQKHFSAIWRCKDSSPNAGAANAPNDTSSVILGCTVGLAFALGITLAGAGLMLGWRMGWIIFPY